MDDVTVRLLLESARRIEEHGLDPSAVDALADGGVTLVIERHPEVPDAWRATVSIGGGRAPLTVDEDAAVAATRALRSAVVHGVAGDKVRLHPVPVRGRGLRAPGRRKK